MGHKACTCCFNSSVTCSHVGWPVATRDDLLPQEMAGCHKKWPGSCEPSCLNLVRVKAVTEICGEYRLTC